ncbi:Uncharacterised protein [Bordetella pertussis]|nr:Uncharacterised protein [Bordetella pertussis]
MRSSPSTAGPNTSRPCPNRACASKAPAATAWRACGPTGRPRPNPWT